MVLMKNCMMGYACLYTYRFVDGKDYMEAVAIAINSAESEIYITDWQ